MAGCALGPYRGTGVLLSRERGTGLEGWDRGLWRLWSPDGPQGTLRRDRPRDDRDRHDRWHPPLDDQ